MWKQYFKFVKLRPGKVITFQFGEIDFSADSIGIEIIKTLYENGFPYLEITEEGKVDLYGFEPLIEKNFANDNSIRVKKSRQISNHD